MVPRQQPYQGQPYGRYPPQQQQPQQQQQAPMGISFKMSPTAMVGMLFGLGSFFTYLIAMMILQFICGIFALIFGIIGLVIGVMVWKTERQRAIVILIFSLMGIIITLLTIAAWTALYGSPV